jgi:Icc-related predicted phosphoesterase
VTRILVVNDIHLRDNAPSSATETYTDDLFDLLAEVAKKEQELEADAVVFAGDLIDFKQPGRTSHRLMLRAMNAMNAFQNPICIYGNHDLTQDRKQSLFDQQPLGVLIQGSKLRLLEGWHETLPLYGVGWLQDWHDGQARMDAFVAWREDPFSWTPEAIAVTHAPLYPLGEENEFDHVPTSGPDGVSAALGGKGFLAYGHIHEYHGIFESGGVTYSNMGALSRGSLHEYNRTRPIAITLWDSTEGFSQVDLPHKPAEEVFRITEIDEAKAQKVDLDAFLEDVGNSTLAQSTTESVAEWLRTHPNVEPPIKQRALGILESLPD